MGPELDRLPPPAFPPGSRRSSASTRSLRIEGEESEGDDDPSDIPEDAFISPDDPIRKRGRGIPDDAFISPDDPLVPRARDREGRIVEVEDETEAPATTRPRRGTPTIHELPYLLDQLAERLHESGERALDVHPDMGHFQAALRAFLKGYLEGGRD